MSNLLRAMGFWMWGLIAIGLSVSLVSVSYRMLSVYRSHDLSADSPSSAPSPNAEVAPPPTLFGEKTKRAPSALKEIGVGASRQGAVTAEKMTASRGPAQADQEALNSLEAAEPKATLTTTNDSKSVQEISGYSNFTLDKFRAAQTAYEAALSRGAYKEEELVRVFRTLFQLAAALQQPAKAIEYGEKANELGALKSNDLLIMSQFYYLQRNCKDSAVWGDKAIAAFKKAGEPPKEVLYQLKLQCASDANDSVGMIAALYDLVRLTNKISYWNNLIRLERQDERDDRNLLMIYRVMYDTNSMQADTDYIEMAQLLGDAGLPGEAQLVLGKALKSGVVKEEHRERTARLLNAMKTRAEMDKKGLPALDAESSRNPAGQLDVKLGEIYFGAGDYQGASVAISRGLGKGQIKQPDEAYVYLGRYWIAQNETKEAKNAFAQLKTLPNASARVLRLWNLYADTIPEARSASL
jgi:tetratricopeptide (TPR) repeat protein